VKKELRPVHDNVACDVCGRTILKGERAEPYLAPGGQRHQVCQLCFGRAENAGWIRESGSGQLPARGPRQQERRPLLERLRRRRPEPVETAAEPEAPEPFDEAPEEEPPPQAAPRSVPKDPRHVRAVPTTAEVKVERALDLFNRSEHARTVVGLTRSLGAPLVAALPSTEAPSEVTIVVAWELSWYRYTVDLGDEVDPVELEEKGDEIDQLTEDLRDWNGALDASGDLVLGVGSQAK
jgi:hypothetical protein